jgi:hypothetical protein
MKTKTIIGLSAIGLVLLIAATVSAVTHEAYCSYDGMNCCHKTTDPCGTSCNANSGQCYGGWDDGCTGGSLSPHDYDAGASTGGVECAACATGQNWAISYSGSSECSCATG